MAKKKRDGFLLRDTVGGQRGDHIRVSASDDKVYVKADKVIKKPHSNRLGGTPGGHPVQPPAQSRTTFKASPGCLIH